MPPERSAVVVLVTAGSPDEGARIAEALVAERLAACVSRVPAVESVYRWQGAIERATEVLLIIKTRADRVEPLIARVRALHSYSVPEVVALPVTAGNPDYLRWLDTETG